MAHLNWGHLILEYRPEDPRRNGYTDRSSLPSKNGLSSVAPVAPDDNLKSLRSPSSVNHSQELIAHLLKETLEK